MLQPHAAVAYNPVTVARTLAQLPIGIIAGEVARFDITSSTSNGSGDTVFDVLINGVSIWAADLTQRPKILQGQTSVHVTGLSVAVVIGDIVTINAVTVPSGGIGGILALIVSVEDGLPTGIPAGGTVGQILSKASGTDFDTGWVDAPTGGGAGGPRDDVVLTTASLADLATEVGTVALGMSFELLQVVADRACRVRLYTNANARTTDATRPVGTDPDLSANHGVIADLSFQSGHLTIETLDVSGFNNDAVVSDLIYYSVTNLSGAAHTVQVTFTRRETEA